MLRCAIMRACVNGSDNVERDFSMGRVKMKRGLPDAPRYEVLSNAGGLFTSFEFLQGERDLVEEHWAEEVSRCEGGDLVELFEYGKRTRVFEGKSPHGPTVLCRVQRSVHFMETRTEGARRTPLSGPHAASE
jgi:hypothetical protein